MGTKTQNEKEENFEINRRIVRYYKSKKKQHKIIRKPKRSNQSPKTKGKQHLKRKLGTEKNKSKVLKFRKQEEMKGEII